MFIIRLAKVKRSLKWTMLSISKKASDYDGNKLDLKIVYNLYWNTQIYLKSVILAGHQWPMPVILATQETEVRRVTV
jgi:hypothetical protein